jgi:hypothetical protein
MQVPENVVALDVTESLCPICLKVVDARVVIEDGSVVLKRVCPDHGLYSAHLWPNADHYKWMNSFRLPFTQPDVAHPIKNGCPQDCGLCASHLRCPTLSEIEVTLRCNLRCPVCFMAAEGMAPDPSLDVIAGMYVAIAQNAGTQTSIQLTGGEPTVRRDLPEIVALGRKIGFSAIEINSNGLAISRAPEMLARLVDAGLTGVYLQFDGLNEMVYKRIRGAALLDNKLRAIEYCRSAGVQVVLAMTLIEGINTDQIGPTLAFALDNLDVVVGLALQPAFTSGRFEVNNSHRIGMGDVIFMLADQSGGLIEPQDLWPLGCSHPLCSCSTIFYDNGSTIRPLTRSITPEDYVACFNPHSPQGSVFADILSKIQPLGSQTGRFGRGLSVVIMNYMDAWNIDLQRLKECSMTVAMPDGRLIPFCAYHLTNLAGRRIYPPLGNPLPETRRIEYSPRSGETIW